MFRCTNKSIPTNVASMHLVMGCPNARAGFKIIKKETLGTTKSNLNFDPHHCHLMV